MRKTLENDSKKSILYFGLNFIPMNLSEAAYAITEHAIVMKKGLVVTPNVDHIVLLDIIHGLREIYKNASFVFADGMPLVWLSRLIHKSPLPERVTGADLLPSVCELSSCKQLKVFFLGGNPGVAEMAAENLKRSYPGLIVSGIYCPPFGFENDLDESNKIVRAINSSDTNILFIGVGAPKQEQWAAAYLDKLNVGPVLCVGAAFDFAAGTVKRAPEIFQKSGVEWLWRLCSEPGRLWKRYIIRDSRFIILALKEIFGSIINKSHNLS